MNERFYEKFVGLMLNLVILLFLIMVGLGIVLTYFHSQFIGYYYLFIIALLISFIFSMTAFSILLRGQLRLPMKNITPALFLLQCGYQIVFNINNSCPFCKARFPII